MTRRTAAGLMALSALRASQTSPIGIGFLGLSHSHGDGKLDVVLNAPSDWRVVGVTESDPGIREQLRKKNVPVLERAALLAHPDIRVIAVESAVRDHAADGIAVLEAGKHLHLEKAPADSMAPFEKVVSLARSKSLLLQVGYMWRYHPGIETAIEAARSGWLGSVYLVRAAIGNQLPARRRPEWAEFAGGNMFELGGHVIDPMVRLMGRPSDITPVLRTDGDFADKLRDNNVAIFQWAKAIGIVHGANLQQNASRYRAFEVHGTNGTAIVNPIEPAVLKIDLDKPAGPYRKGEQSVELPPYKRYVDDMRELAQAVRGEKKLRVSLDEDLIVQEALLRASGMYSR